MKKLMTIAWLVVLLVLTAGLTQAQGPDGGPAAPAGSAFTYQGRLQKENAPVDDTCAMEFRLYDLASGGAQVGPTLTRGTVLVSEGLFTIPDLDFGAVFDGEARWLEIAVRCSGDPGFITLQPRQELTPTPYAMGVPWSGISAMPAGFADGIDNEGSGDHDHWGQSWSGSGTGLGLSSVDGSGLQASTAANNGRAVHAVASSLTGFTYGVYAAVDSTQGRGVYGYAGAATGATYGVLGESASNGGYGVMGYATAVSGGVGVRGESASTNGRGVFGYATAATGPAFGVWGQSSSENGRAVYGTATATTGTTYGLYGHAASPNGSGVYGYAESSGGDTYGVHGQVNSSDGAGVYGSGPVVGVKGTASSTTYHSTVYGVYGEIAGTGATNSAGVSGWNKKTSGAAYGVYARSESTAGYALFALASATSGTTYAVFGRTLSPSGYGVYGDAVDGSGANYGVYGTTASPSGYGVYGIAPTYGVVGSATDASGTSIGVLGVASSASGGVGVRGYGGSTSGTNYGVYGWTSSPSGYGVYGRATSSTANYAGYFSGNVAVTGNLSKGGGSFKIDHPLDPANKYLYHSFVESPDMMNIYNGLITLGPDGTAWVELPAWFEALNGDYRYQLTCVGGYAPVYIAQKVQGNRFQIAGGIPALEVSWQVTGIRQDPYANAHRIPVEEDKPASERGTYLYPGLYGKPEEMGLDYRRENGLLEVAP